MGELKVEVGVKDSFKKTLVRSRLKWAGHVERMGDEKLAKRLPESGRKRNEEDREHNGRKTENTVGGRQRTQWEEDREHSGRTALRKNLENVWRRM